MAPIVDVKEPRSVRGENVYGPYPKVGQLGRSLVLCSILDVINEFLTPHSFCRLDPEHVNISNVLYTI